MIAPLRMLFGLLLVCATVAAAAHPAVGIVRDRQGNVYYSDLVHVWRIAPDGRKVIVVRDVHTHELARDSAGTLYGEDSEYLGGERYRHRIWRRTSNGSVEDVVPWRAGFWRAYGFVRDSHGATYWTQCPERHCTIFRRGTNGHVTRLRATRPFTHLINWIAPAPDGAPYVIEGEALKVLEVSGKTRTLVASLGHAPMGLWPTAEGSVHVAVYGRRAIVRVSPSGRVTLAAKTPAPWGPSGVTLAPNGDLWVLEYSTSNTARVRRIPVRGPPSVY